MKREPIALPTPRDPDGGKRGVLGGEKLAELGEFGVKEAGGAALTGTANSEKALLADRGAGAQRKMDIRT